MKTSASNSMPHQPYLRPSNAIYLLFLAGPCRSFIVKENLSSFAYIYVIVDKYIKIELECVKSMEVSMENTQACKQH